MMCQRSSVSVAKEKREYENVRVRWSTEWRPARRKIQELGFAKGRWEDAFCFFFFSELLRFFAKTYCKFNYI